MKSVKSRADASIGIMSNSKNSGSVHLDAEALQLAIRKDEERLAELDRERAAVEERLQRNRGLAGRAAPLHSRSPAEKIAVFRSLFRGRVDVFPKRWENPRKGTKGYSPACANEWVRPICEKPKVKCSECPNQAWLPVTDQVIRDHLQGKLIAGVYPLLEDETCWFLAADFDKGDWEADAHAFITTCRDQAIPFALERSRSGNGAHVWFFFTAPVNAAAARRMGCYLLTETMSRRHQVPMASYDRLFPNQDTMPKGGFGNLIALPLQAEPRKSGNTLFLDDDLAPLRDQWEFLATVPRLTPVRVDEVADQAVRTGRVVGLRFPEPLGDEHDATPWTRPPSRRRTRPVISGPLPATVPAVLAQRLFIAKEGLPSPLLNEIKRLAAFPNPKFYECQRLRLQTARTPRVIACAEELDQHIALPRGCLSDAEDLFDDHGVTLQIDDKRESGAALDVTFHGRLTDLQTRAAGALLAHDTGVFVAPPGVGKTVVGIHLIAARARNTLVLVHRRPLQEQWVAQIAMFLGVDRKQIGQIAAAKRKITGQVDVAMIQSLVRQDSVDDLVAGYGHVIVDECHHVPAVSFEKVLKELKARYITGLTATPQRRDGHHPILNLQIGPVRFGVSARDQAAHRPFRHVLRARETGFQLDSSLALPPIQDLYRALAADVGRNQLILTDIEQALAEGRSPIVLTERRDHIAYLASELGRTCPNVIVMQGGVGAKQRRAIVQKLAEVPANEPRVVVATGKYAGEGFDDPRLDTLFLAMPVAWKGSIVQYTGRLHRLQPGKEEVRIYDYVDRAVPMLARMFEKRLKAYRAIGYGDGQSKLFAGR